MVVGSRKRFTEMLRGLMCLCALTLCKGVRSRGLIVKKLDVLVRNPDYFIHPQFQAVTFPVENASNFSLVTLFNKKKKKKN